MMAVARDQSYDYREKTKQAALGLPGEDKASCTSKEQCGKDDIYDKHKNIEHRIGKCPTEGVHLVYAYRL